MERLTAKCLKGSGYYMACSKTCPYDCMEDCDCEEFDNFVNRLGAIEDILGDEYDLDELAEKVQANREGRCVVLKCKPNATVWFIKSAFSTAHFPIEGNHVSIKGVACDGDIYCSAITAYNKISRSFYMSDIGKTVFLTREEAEAALRREQDE